MERKKKVRDGAQGKAGPPRMPRFQKENRTSRSVLAKWTRVHVNDVPIAVRPRVALQRRLRYDRVETPLSRSGARMGSRLEKKSTAVRKRIESRKCRMFTDVPFC